MLKGVFKKRVKPIAYYFVNSTLDPQFAKDIIINAIQKLQRLGLSVIAVHSTDQRTNYGRL